MGYIYCITNLINKKKYVGKSTYNVNKRFKEHCRDAFKERCEKRPLYNAIRKYGVKNFLLEVLEECLNPKLLSKLEIDYIKKLNTYGKFGYNATRGGDGALLYNPDEILTLYNSGLDCVEVSKIIKCSPDTVYKILQENKIKIRYVNKGHVYIAVNQYDLKMNFIQSWDNLGDAARWLFKNNYTKRYNRGIKSHISACAKGKVKTAYRFIWKFQ